MQDDNPRKIPTDGTGSSNSPLDSLLSPKDPAFATLPSRESLAESSFNEVNLEDDSRFSTVPLSGHNSLLSVSSDQSALSKAERRTTIHAAFANTIPPSRPKHAAHKKSASSVIFRPSSTSLPFVLSRLGIQKGEDESDLGSPKFNSDGQHKLHEEFLRLHNERRKQVEAEVDSVIDWDFWGSVISDYQKFAADNPESLAKAIEKGIPDTLRGMMWQLMAASKDTELEDTYLKLLKETSPHEKAITRDLGRTFPHHEFFTDGQGIGQENLFNVLKAYSLYDTQVGYCQGLPFVVAILLLNMPDEEAFSLLVRLMHSYDLRGHFLPEMPKLQLRLFDRLVEELLPVLHVHFLRQGIKSSMFASQWFLTLFSYRFPLDIVFRIYDNCLASGIEAIFAFSIVLLHKNEEALLQLKFDDILTFLKARVFDKYKIESTDSSTLEAQDDKHTKYRVDEFVQDAISLKVTPFMLDAYSHEYEDHVRTREAHAIEVDTLRNHNRNLSAQVKHLENDLAQLNTEHVELLNELVMARLRNEEMESELVRYKLLYAEAMHENEDAMSCNRRSASTFLSKRGSS
ncbi:hypothetical protein SERLA73DRAFT_179863 [Serpula lacrymans var. lacrymans S7.3]|uniref:Rab-GAP TBC domain-containing protein n=2 Tax=Serpula lacrymans var. lacrymans TaxID=341189 RepID=F8PUV0_SERL3|nr:uncharacterized protein SERLADRAFT_465163 [Serpula lacrymans var. lacrymans S7.9]EGN99714.1 hypothetical protein SERLA73DRAFT_179863 [Serpula lacrymans var. lacrymans S7.3]EGO25279.1 hypothetical protein SERLADRAFT_465163 [Serpula lacrymans var. lacrymans S7.9]